MPARAGAAALLAGALSLAALAALALPAHSAVEPACGALGASRAVQDDALSGRDAGDGPWGAVGLERDDYVWGFLDPQADHGAADVRDWYQADVPAADPSREVTVGIVLLPAASLAVPHGVYPPVTLFGLRVWVPGEEAPRTTDTASGNLTFKSGAGGRWWFEASLATGVEAPLCQGPAPAPHLGEVPQPANDYGVYFGCKPFCLMGPAG